MENEKPVNVELEGQGALNAITKLYKEQAQKTLSSINQDRNEININEYNNLSMSERRLLAKQLVHIEENALEETLRGAKKYTLNDLGEQNHKQMEELQKIMNLPKPPEEFTVLVGNKPISMAPDAAKLFLGDVKETIEEMEKVRGYFLKPESPSRITGGDNASHAENLQPTPVSVANAQGKSSVLSA